MHFANLYNVETRDAIVICKSNYRLYFLIFHFHGQRSHSGINRVMWFRHKGYLLWYSNILVKYLTTWYAISVQVVDQDDKIFYVHEVKFVYDLPLVLLLEFSQTDYKLYPPLTVKKYPWPRNPSCCKIITCDNNSNVVIGLYMPCPHSYYIAVVVM